jgi:hypothetical protein
LLTSAHQDGYGLSEGHPSHAGAVIPILDHVTALRAESDMRWAAQLSELDRRVQTQLAEMDLRYQQRYDASNKALEAALLAAEKAVTTALVAAEKAVTKAETAAEKRFDAVNEFRGAYQDIIAQQLPRAEGDAKFMALAEKMDAIVANTSERLEMLTKLMDTQTGRHAGLSAGYGYLVAGASVLVALAVLAVMVLK